MLVFNIAELTWWSSINCWAYGEGEQLRMQMYISMRYTILCSFPAFHWEGSKCGGGLLVSEFR